MKKTNSLIMYHLFKKKMKQRKAENRHGGKHPTSSINSPDKPSPLKPLKKSTMAAKPFKRMITMDFSGELEIKSRRPCDNLSDIMEILGLWIDEYEGPAYTKPLITGVYIILGVSLKPTKSYGDHYHSYKSTINQRISFLVMGNEFEIHEHKMKWLRSKGVGDSHFKISLQLTMSKTTRTGLEFKEICKSVFSTSSLKEFIRLAHQFHVPCNLIDGDIIFSV